MPSLSARNSSLRRALGQVFTPRCVADWMAEWVCQDSPARILDPSVGAGVFIDAVEAVGGQRARVSATAIDAYEVDPALLAGLRDAPRRLCVRKFLADFVTARIPTPYDAIIANPPYVRHHTMKYGEEVFAAFDRLCGRRISRNTNLYGLFLMKIANLLGARGRAAIITPAEWLNADFGVAIKAHLLSRNLLEAIIHFDHASCIFPGTLTTAAITLLRNGRRPVEPVALAHLPDADALSTLRLKACRRMSPALLDSRVKWTPVITCDKPPPEGPRLGNIASCMRGIATGANDYFTLRPSDLIRWGIDRRDVQVCITKARQIRGPVLGPNELSALQRADERMFLLSPRRPLRSAVKKYLEIGRRREIDRRYLPAHRPTWFLPEARPPAPILVSVFVRGRFRFVLNKARALNLTAFHGIYPCIPRRAPQRCFAALFDYLSSEVAQDALRRNRRIYGGGLEKVEPRDVEALPIPPELARRYAGETVVGQLRGPESIRHRVRRADQGAGPLEKGAFSCA